jgi:hypothetical protein
MSAGIKQDSEKDLEKILSFERLISDLSAHFLNISQESVDREIDLALKKILDFFQVDRCNLLKLLPDKNSWKVAYRV